jgi:hypothetical protein
MKVALKHFHKKYSDEEPNNKNCSSFQGYYYVCSFCTENRTFIYKFIPRNTYSLTINNQPIFQGEHTMNEVF